MVTSHQLQSTRRLLSQGAKLGSTRARQRHIAPLSVLSFLGILVEVLLKRAASLRYKPLQNQAGKLKLLGTLNSEQDWFPSADSCCPNEDRDVWRLALLFVFGSLECTLCQRPL